MIYYGLFAFGVLSALLSHGQTNLTGAVVNATRRNLFPWYLFMVSVILVIGLRDNVGNDFPSYVNAFQLALNDRSIRFEPGFQVIYRLALALPFGYSSVFLVGAILANVFVFRRVAEYSASIGLSLVILFGTNFFFRQANIVRQAAAMGIFFFSIRYLLRGDLKKYLLCVVAATAFHYSAAAMLPFYWLLRRKYTRVELVGLSIASVAVALTPQVLKLAISVFGGLIPHVYQQYLSRIDSLLDAASEGKRIFLEAVLGLALALIYPERKYRGAEYRLYLNLLLLGLVAQGLVGRIWGLSRLPSYLLLFQCLAIPNVISGSGLRRETRMLVGLGVVVYYGFFLWDAINRNSNQILPYDSVVFRTD